MQMKKKLITSALPYVNNVPHLGNIIGSVLLRMFMLDTVAYEIMIHSIFVRQTNILNSYRN